MTKNDLDLIKKWFSYYCRSHYSSIEDDQKNIALKELHSYNVCRNAIRIGKEIGLNEQAMLLVEVTGLLHDVGRFEQYAEYKTFRDSSSVNHGMLGAQEITKKRVLQGLVPEERDLVLDVVKYHNAFVVPDLKDERKMLFLKIVRDADKLDIWRVFKEYYQNPEDTASAVNLGLPDSDNYSQDIISCIKEKRIGKLSDAKTLTDFKLLQLSWVYDLNFSISTRIAIEQGYVDIIEQQLPETDEIKNALAVLNSYLKERALLE
ncbi:MAG: HD domain-containing protein [Dissulfurispiraceae bacterium]|jgi:hypothetical protein|nr:HD domain-containing protein [Dissulfurispiraceae bacterium]